MGLARNIFDLIFLLSVLLPFFLFFVFVRSIFARFLPVQDITIGPDN